MKYEYYIPYDYASLIFFLNNQFYFFFSSKFDSRLMFSAELFLVIHISNVDHLRYLPIPLTSLVILYMKQKYYQARVSVYSPNDF
jgi:hypothetical protein